MGLAKCYALIHAIADQNGAETIWADEDKGGQVAWLEQARSIMRSHYKFRE